MSANKITGRSAFMAVLKDEGITQIFGNPGILLSAYRNSRKWRKYVS